MSFEHEMCDSNDDDDDADDEKAKKLEKKVLNLKSKTNNEPF